MTTMQTLDANDTLAARFIAGASTELSYMTADQADAARALETELLADAAAGVDLRIRLITNAIGGAQ
jgi:hypothetical protein